MQIIAQVATVALMRHGGSHLIRPMVSELGFDIVEPGNFGAPLDISVGPVIVWLRDPRDRMVATMRWWRGKPRKCTILAEQGDSDDEHILCLLNDQGFLDEMLRWAKIWCNWPRALTLKFEDAKLHGPFMVKSIAEHLELERNTARDLEVFNNSYRKGRTYTGRHSNWRDSFGPLSTRFWNKNGGVELLELMRYL